MQSLAKEIVRSKQAVNRLYENKAQLNSVSMHLGELVGMDNGQQTVGHLSKSAEAGVIEEMVNDAVDTALDSEDIEEEIEEEVDKVLAAIAGETVSQLPDAVRKEKIQQPSASVDVEEREAVAEGADDEDLDEIRERLARVRS
ncbi:hypothetical protein BHM03_00002375 [Ensete ventricosum]|nr:hypothetical protein BHM03_00002375 [Ensete ventricosum]